MIFVDTNYFLRFLLNEVSVQNETVIRLFEEGARGKVKFFSSVVVFFEIYWVFTSFYKKQKPEVVEILANVLQMKFVRFEQEKILIAAHRLFATQNIDLEDAYNLMYAHTQKATEFKTFDQKTQKLFS